jgi:hypothetical protein
VDAECVRAEAGGIRARPGRAAHGPQAHPRAALPGREGVRPAAQVHLQHDPAPEEQGRGAQPRRSAGSGQDDRGRPVAQAPWEAQGPRDDHARGERMGQVQLADDARCPCRAQRGERQELFRRHRQAQGDHHRPTLDDQQEGHRPDRDHLVSFTAFCAPPTSTARAPSTSRATAGCRTSSARTSGRT